MRIPSPSSLAFRLTGWYTGSAFLLLTAASAVLYHGMTVSVDYEDNTNLAQQVTILHDLLKNNPDNTEMLQQKVVLEPAAKSYAPMLTRLMDGRGRTIMESPGMGQILPAELFPAPRSGVPVWDASGEVTANNSHVFRVLSQDLAVAGSSKLGVGRVQLALDHTAEEGLFARYRYRLGQVLGVGLVTSAAMGYVIARRGIRPIRRVADTVRRIGSSTLHERIDAAGFPSELVGLATTLNGMLDRLEDAFARLTRFSGDIAHELRTPINILRGEAEVALTKERSEVQYREVLGSSLEECARLTRLIDRLLFLARAESPASQVRRERIDVGAELATLCDFYDAAAGEAGIVLELYAPGDDIIRSLGFRPHENGDAEPPAGPDASPPGQPAAPENPIGPIGEIDRTLFQRAVGNLIENALNHTAHGGRVRVRADAVPGENGVVPMLRVGVADNGRGIPKGDLPYVFDRFHRVDESRSKVTGGAGLGLAIVKTIATLHGGSVAIDSELGNGTTVTLRFPQPSKGFATAEPPSPAKPPRQPASA